MGSVLIILLTPFDARHTHTHICTHTHTYTHTHTHTHMHTHANTHSYNTLWDSEIHSHAHACTSDSLTPHYQITTTYLIRSAGICQQISVAGGTISHLLACCGAAPRRKCLILGMWTVLFGKVNLKYVTFYLHRHFSHSGKSTINLLKLVRSGDR